MANAETKKDRPLAVAICALVKDGKILLIKRIKGDYMGLWGLPGGKVEKEEHLSDAAVREIREESGIDSVFVSLLGLVSEHLIADGKITNHFLLHVCGLEPKKTTEIKNNQEGELKWFDLGLLPKEDIIPSDLLMIEKLVRKRQEGRYYNCAIEKKGDGKHVLKKFEPIGLII